MSKLLKSLYSFLKEKNSKTKLTDLSNFIGLGPFSLLFNLFELSPQGDIKRGAGRGGIFSVFAKGKSLLLLAFLQYLLFLLLLVTFVAQAVVIKFTVNPISQFVSRGHTVIYWTAEAKHLKFSTIFICLNIDLRMKKKLLSWGFEPGAGVTS